MTTQWPGTPVDADGTDLAKPVGEYLDAAKLLKPAENLTGTKEIIEAAELGITSTVRNIIAAGGGTAAVVGGISGVWAGVTENTSIAVVAIAGAAVVLAATILGLAQVMNGDVRGRAAVTTEQIEQRGHVAATFLETASAQARGAPAAPGRAEPLDAFQRDLRFALAAYRGRLQVNAGKSAGPVVGLRWEGDRLRLRLESGDWVDDRDVVEFESS